MSHVHSNTHPQQPPPADKHTEQDYDNFVAFSLKTVRRLSLTFCGCPFLDPYSDSNYCVGQIFYEKCQCKESEEICYFFNKVYYGVNGQR
jgi:hypothetical protein